MVRSPKPSAQVSPKLSAHVSSHAAYTIRPSESPAQVTSHTACGFRDGVVHESLLFCILYTISLKHDACLINCSFLFSSKVVAVQKKSLLQDIHPGPQQKG